MNDSQKPRETPDDIGPLVRLAEDSEISTERMERVRSVARAAWQEKTQRRSRGRAAWWVAAVAAMLAGVAFISSVVNDTGTQPTIELALVESLSGGVTLDTGEGATILTPGGSVPMNAAVATSVVGAVALRLPSGHSLRIDAGSEVALRDDGSVALVAGTVYFESDPDRPGESIDVLTPFGTVHEIGTQFELRLRQRGLRIRTREGAVRLARPGRDLSVTAGNELSMDDSGRTETKPIPTYGNEWDWVTSMASVPDLRGQSAYAFLNWTVRERGWTLAFNDEGSLRAAQETIVEGRLEQLTPDEALGAVMQASRLGYRVADGKLVVSTQP